MKHLRLLWSDGFVKITQDVITDVNNSTQIELSQWWSYMLHDTDWVQTRWKQERLVLLKFVLTTWPGLTLIKGFRCIRKVPIIHYFYVGCHIDGKSKYTCMPALESLACVYLLVWLQPVWITVIKDNSSVVYEDE